MTIIISFTIIVVMVYILAIITDEFFVVSLDEVATRMNMPSDVAGASLMAVGSSAPELFIALMAVLGVGGHEEIGMGTIVGSAVFNILVITGASALFAENLTISGRSVERDIIFYLASIALLLFVFWDGTIVLWEALFLVAFYALYILILWRWGENNPREEETHAIPEIKMSAENPPRTFWGNINHGIASVFRIITRDPKENYVWTMFISIAAIAAISWVLVQSAVALADGLGLSPVIVSLTLLAAGTSAPDLIASVSVAKDGRGEMAVANAVGSDIFDVLIGLGVPWVLTILLFGHSVNVGTDGLMSSIFILSGTVVILYIFLYTGRRLNRIEGWSLLALYVAYVIYAVVTN